MPSSNQPIRLPVRRTINAPMVAYAAPASPLATFASPSATIMARQPTSVRTGPANASTAVAIHRAFEPRRARPTAMEAIIVRGADRDQGCCPATAGGWCPPSGLAVEPWRSFAPRLATWITTDRARLASSIQVEAGAFANADATTRNLHYGRVLGEGFKIPRSGFCDGPHGTPNN